MDVVIDRHDHTVVARLNRPERMNALSSSVCEALNELAEEIARDIEIRCLIITGTGRAFCAGADLKERGELSARDRWTYVRRLNEVIGKLDSIPVPVIAAINGYALGGGLELASISDFRLAVSTAVLGLPEARWGIIAGGSIVRLVRDISPSAAARLSFTADRIDAAEALRLGLVEAVYDTADALDTAASDLASRITRNAPLALRASKRLLRGVAAGYSANAMRLAMEIREPLENTKDSVEGLRAFAEKRDPVFCGK